MVHWRTVVLLTGGFLLNIVPYIQIAGSINAWGSILGYVGSYYHNKDYSVQISDLAIVVSISYLAESLCTVLLSVLFAIFSPMIIIFLGPILSSTIIFLSSYIQDSILFCWVYGIGLGILSGTIFLPSTIILWEKIHTHKGRTTGILLAGYNLGGAFGLIFTYLVNPNNYSTEDTGEDGEEKEKYFGRDITDSVPASIRWLAVIYIIVVVIGLIGLHTKSDIEKSNEITVKVERTLTFVQVIKMGKFWYFYVLMFLGLACTSYILVTYKIIGIIYINDDHFLAYIGTAMFAIGSIGRLGFGLLFDIFSYKKIMIICYLLTAVELIVLIFCLKNQYLYGFVVIAIGFTDTSVYNGILLQMEHAFPNDKWVISLVSLAYILDFFLPYAAETFITPEIGYFYTFIMLAGFAFISMILVALYTEPKNNDNLLD